MPSSEVIWLNGAFGVGKTTVARALALQLPGAMMFDPEGIGIMLRKAVPGELGHGSDFQDIPLWRRLTFATVEGLVRDYGRTLIVPMTVADPTYFDETVGQLRRTGITVHHFALVGTPTTIRRRLATRLSAPGSTLWAWRHVQRCTTALQSSVFERHVPTDNISVPEVVATIRRASSL